MQCVVFMLIHCLGSVCALWLSKFAYLEYAVDYKADLNKRPVGRPNVSPSWIGWPRVCRICVAADAARNVSNPCV
jgi:hypothetical protein